MRSFEHVEKYMAKTEDDDVVKITEQEQWELNQALRGLSEVEL